MRLMRDVIDAVWYFVAWIFRPRNKVLSIDPSIDDYTAHFANPLPDDDDWDDNEPKTLPTTQFCGATGCYGASGFNKSTYIEQVIKVEPEPPNIDGERTIYLD